MSNFLKLLSGGTVTEKCSIQCDWVVDHYDQDLWWCHMTTELLHSGQWGRRKDTYQHSVDV